MNDLTNLMVHVERIVRPVRALQVRKLHMRRELLNNLQSAFDEERAGGANESTALERVKERLGDPAALTAAMQKSVPWIERTLLLKVPAPRKFDHWENRSMRVFGLDRPLTMAHMALFMAAAATVPYMALVLAVLVVQPNVILAARFDRPAAIVALDLIALALCLISIVTGGRFIATIASKAHPPRAHRAAALGSIVFASPLLIILTAVILVYRRPPTGFEIFRGLIIGATMLAIMFVTGLLIRRLRHRYDEWLTLELA
jgi:hypothetical protein